MPYRRGEVWQVASGEAKRSALAFLCRASDRPAISIRPTYGFRRGRTLTRRFSQNAPPPFFGEHLGMARTDPLIDEDYTARPTTTRLPPAGHLTPESVMRVSARRIAVNNRLMRGFSLNSPRPSSPSALFLLVKRLAAI